MWKNYPFESAVTAREMGQIFRISLKIVYLYGKSTEFCSFQDKNYFE